MNIYPVRLRIGNKKIAEIGTIGRINLKYRCLKIYMIVDNWITSDLTL